MHIILYADFLHRLLYNASFSTKLANDWTDEIYK